MTATRHRHPGPCTCLDALPEPPSLWPPCDALVEVARSDARQAEKAAKRTSERVKAARAVVASDPEDLAAVDELGRAEAAHTLAKARRLAARAVVELERRRLDALEAGIFAAECARRFPDSRDAVRWAQLARCALCDLARARAYAETKQAAAAVAEAELFLIPAGPS